MTKASTFIRIAFDRFIAARQRQAERVHGQGVHQLEAREVRKRGREPAGGAGNLEPGEKSARRKPQLLVGAVPRGGRLEPARRGEHAETAAREQPPREPVGELPASLPG